MAIRGAGVLDAAAVLYFAERAVEQRISA